MVLAKTKKPYAYRTIGEASSTIGVPTHVLRFWETKFSQIRPMKKGGGRRYYRPEDIQLLSAIRVFLYERAYSIKQLQAYLLQEGHEKVVAMVIDIKVKNQTKPLPTKSQTKQKADKQTSSSANSRQEALQNALDSLTNARDILSTTLNSR